MKQESSVQQATFTWNTDLLSMGDSSSVSRVPSSRSTTKAQAADTAPVSRGTHKNSMGHSRVVKASIQAWW